MLGFRVWDTVNKRFDCSDEWAINRDGKLCLVRSPESDLMDMSDDSEFIPMLFTGVKDFKGKEIYEGDVLFIHFRNNLTFENSYFSVENAVDFLTRYGLLLPIINKISCDGNIYECPDLLEKL